MDQDGFRKNKKDNFTIYRVPEAKQLDVHPTFAYLQMSRNK